MKIAVYPGSFNPLHNGHKDVIRKAARLFDKVIVAVGQNPGKPINKYDLKALEDSLNSLTIEVKAFHGFLVDFCKNVNASAVVRGLRNNMDFESEKIQQYWNEDLGLSIPTVYIISDRELVHLSSTAINQVNAMKQLATKEEDA